MAWTEEEKNKITWDDGMGWFRQDGWFQGWFLREYIVSWTEETKNEITWS